MSRNSSSISVALHENITSRSHGKRMSGSEYVWAGAWLIWLSGWEKRKNLRELVWKKLAREYFLHITWNGKNTGNHVEESNSGLIWRILEESARMDRERPLRTSVGIAGISATFQAGHLSNTNHTESQQITLYNLM
jgi:hypothetical protein